ncbi:hypothetical protein [Rubripirellula reticaptiva]|nr:hypothetical protein [Rubripirellula reticaptiva]
MRNVRLAKLMHRFLQFSIAALLIAIAIFAAGFGFFRFFNQRLTVVDEPASGEGYVGRGTYFQGTQLMARVSRSDILVSTRWKPDAQNPPVSARRAIAIANRAIRSVGNIDPLGMEFRNAELTRYEGDIWYWTVFLDEAAGSNDEGFQSGYPIIVLMDERVAVPRPFMQRNYVESESQLGWNIGSTLLDFDEP